MSNEYKNKYLKYKKKYSDLKKNINLMNGGNDDEFLLSVPQPPPPPAPPAPPAPPTLLSRPPAPPAPPALLSGMQFGLFKNPVNSVEKLEDNEKKENEELPTLQPTEKCKLYTFDVNKFKNNVVKNLTAKLKLLDKSEEGLQDVIDELSNTTKPGVRNFNPFKSGKVIADVKVNQIEKYKEDEKQQQILISKNLKDLLFLNNKLDYPSGSLNNLYRTLLPVLINRGMIDVNFTCRDTTKFLSGKQLGKESASKTLQFINIKPDSITEFFNITINEEKISEYVQFIKEKIRSTEEKTGKSIYKCKDDNKMKEYIKGNILNIVNNLKKNFFLKVGTYEGAKTCDSSDVNYDNLTIYDAYNMAFDQNDLFQKNELYFYKTLTNFVFNNNTPHIATYMFNILCKENQDKLFVDELKKPGSDRVGKYGYINMLTETMENSQSLKTYFENNNKDKYNETVSILLQVIFQLIYTLAIFEKKRFIHNDLHAGNIMIETADKEFEFYYVLSDYNETDLKKVIKLKSRYFARIYDFDRSYIIDDEKYEMITDDEQTPQALLEELKTRFNKDIKSDMVKLQGQINTQIIMPYKTDKELDKTWISQLDILKLGSGDNTAVNYIQKLANNLPECLKPYITVYDDLSVIPITKDNIIFFHQTANIITMTESIRKNDSWRKLSFTEKILVCHPLVVHPDITNIQDITCQ